ncbi:MAG: hypothetical protein RIC06_02040 [Cyclobacteriaceae bacterium]
MSCNSRNLSRWLLLSAAFFFSLSLFAQEKQHVRVELIDNSLYVGPVFQSIDSLGVYLNIEGTEVLIPHDRIENIQFHKMKRPVVKSKDRSFSGVEPGYYHTIGLGSSFGNSNPGLSLNLVNGYMFNPYLGAGIGIGFEALEDISTFPVYVELKGYIMQRWLAPFYFFRPGYGFLNTAYTSFENTKEVGGIYWQAGVGYQFNFSESAVAISICSMGQDAKVTYTYPEWWWTDDTVITEKRMKRRMALRIEFTF